jgi:hypothetical protein
MNITIPYLKAEQCRLKKIIERAVLNAGKRNVTFETIGYGEDLNQSPFENNLPEERFYNRTVIIDIVPVK